MSLFNSLCRRLCLSISVHKSEKQSKLCLPGSHYLSSFWELSKSIWIVLFQNFRELGTVGSFENYPIRSAQVQSPLAEVTASRKFIKASCIVYVVSGVTDFDFSRGYQNNILKNKEKQKDM